MYLSRKVGQLLLLPLLDELRFCSQNALRKCVLLFEFPALKALVIMVRGILFPRAAFLRYILLI